MAIHLFVAILSEYLQGNKTGGEAKSAIEAHLGQSLDANDAQDITDTLSYIQAGTDTFDKRNRLDEIYRVAILCEHGVWYATAVDMRNRLAWSEPL